MGDRDGKTTIQSSPGQKKKKKVSNPISTNKLGMKYQLHRKQR
jgi:hypothetical protein